MIVNWPQGVGRVVMSSEAAGSATALTLYKGHHTWLRSWLARRLGCAWDAADLAQDTFTRVLSRKDLHGIRQPRAFLTTVAHGRMVNHLRRKEIERAHLEELAALPAALAPDPAQHALIVEALAAIYRLLDGLPAAVREAF